MDLVEQTLDEDAARARGSTLVCSVAAVCESAWMCAESGKPRLPSVTHAHRATRFSCVDGKLLTVGSEAFEVRQGRQIVHIDDLCNECGNCTTFCVHQGSRIWTSHGCSYGERISAVRMTMPGSSKEPDSTGARVGGTATDQHGEVLVFDNRWVCVRFAPICR